MSLYNNTNLNNVKFIIKFVYFTVSKDYWIEKMFMFYFLYVKAITN